MGSYIAATFEKPIKMKLFLPLIVLLASLLQAAAQESPAKTKKLIIITIDGFRWQEIFNGADSLLISNEDYVKDTALTRSMYWDATAEGRRRKLLPFFWGTIADKGRLYGNRNFDNK